MMQIPEDDVASYGQIALLAEFRQHYDSVMLEIYCLLLIARSI